MQKKNSRWDVSLTELWQLFSPHLKRWTPFLTSRLRRIPPLNAALWCNTQLFGRSLLPLRNVRHQLSFLTRSSWNFCVGRSYVRYENRGQLRSRGQDRLSPSELEFGCRKRSACRQWRFAFWSLTDENNRWNDPDPILRVNETKWDTGVDLLISEFRRIRGGHMKTWNPPVYNARV